jgi:nucleoside-triphosphatase THEP1
VHNDIESGCKLIVLDEIGKWELKGGGWHPLIAELVSKQKIPMLWVVRQDFTNQIKSFYSQNQAIEINIEQTTVAQAAEVIICALNASN